MLAPGRGARLASWVPEGGSRVPLSRRASATARCHAGHRSQLSRPSCCRHGTSCPAGTAHWCLLAPGLALLGTLHIVRTCWDPRRKLNLSRLLMLMPCSAAQLKPPGRGQVPQRGLHRAIATSPAPASAATGTRWWWLRRAALQRRECRGSHAPWKFRNTSAKVFWSHFRDHFSFLVHHSIARAREYFCNTLSDALTCLMIRKSQF